MASSGRLRILATLAAEARVEFVSLRHRTRLTDGNLACHTRRLESAGFVAVEKSFRGRKPVTHLRLTALGRSALEQHARELLDLIGALSGGPPQQQLQAHHRKQRDDAADDDWVD
jgi:DNA-binding MarR family transcriptional regulator